MADVPPDEHLGVDCTTDWSRRQLAWLRARVGDAAIREAVARLPPGRRPWPFNVARQLRLRLPEHLAVDPAKPAAVFAAAKAMLAGKKNGSQ